MTEFDLIARYFTRPAKRAAGLVDVGVALGVGDDCALLNPTPGMQLAISSDMLVEGRHFFANVSPYCLGHKALAVNLSDLAACGATPVAFTLALALPSINEAWLQAFSRGIWALADAHGCELIGGDTTQGPLNICITVFGEVPRGQALLRSGAKVGDDITSAARWAMRAWHSMRCKASFNCRLKYWQRRGSGWNNPHPESHWVPPCAASPHLALTSATGWRATWATC